ncbi:MAG: hypothetical protein IKK82_07760 [Kiritimatiellae bacterium]|nr:hypothetical protein [Kiritimatiellia bacterium]
MLISNEEVIANREQFAEWDSAVSRSQDAAYKQHKVDVLEYWLEAKIPNRGIGNLFRFDQAAEFEVEKARIINLPEFDDVNKADQNGRPLAALNSFGRYLVSLQAGRIDADISTGTASSTNEDSNVIPQATPRDSRRIAANDRVINCLDGLIELIVGADNGGLSDEEKLRSLVRHMIQRSYFFRRESVDRRHQEILALIRNDDRIPVRYSTVMGAYTEEDGTAVGLVGREVAIDASSQRRIMYNSFGRRVPVIVDHDGNREVREVIERFSGARVSQGRDRNNITSAIISHVWGNAYDPLCFTNLWNIVVIPDYINSILDKKETLHPANFFERAVNYVTAYYKELCYKLYDMGNKISEYEELGFEVRPLFADAAASNIVRADDMQGLNFLEDQWGGR